jgi:hypothetical protein
MEDQTFETQKQELLALGIDIENNKIKDMEIPPFMSAIIFRLWQDKNQFVSRETIMEIRKPFYRKPNLSRNMAPEMSRIIKELNKLFIGNKIQLTIVPAMGRIMLHEN